MVLPIDDEEPRGESYTIWKNRGNRSSRLPSPFTLRPISLICIKCQCIEKFPWQGDTPTFLANKKVYAYKHYGYYWAIPGLMNTGRSDLLGAEPKVNLKEHRPEQTWPIGRSEIGLRRHRLQVRRYSIQGAA